MKSNSTNKCFEGLCECSCGHSVNLFDQKIEEETKMSIRLKHFCHSNIGWFTDKSLCIDSQIRSWRSSNPIGVYLLWHKDGYCTKHNLYHMKCLYVGKGEIVKRIESHFQNKDFSDEMLVYFTYYELPNRLAKYSEQLILDVFDIPFNKSENSGNHTLCAHLTQTEVD